MKKFILTLALIATLSVSVTSCSTDDSALEQTTSADGGLSTGNGDVNLPRPTLPRT
ncbi:hypothetical protein [Flavobacterium subsaxonicum]|uniref:hypothetical protein n=1 Tax=Flavobacterium subsaxonicum TaxID=426226 RepID=UPI000421F5E1|nr:hypothetical protein [Flavobacterium subsaxonicum]